MAIKAAVVVLHGMAAPRGFGSVKDDTYADRMIEKVGQALQKRGIAPSEIAWKPVYWADILKARQEEYYRRIPRKGFWEFLGVRRMMVTMISDVAAYQKVHDIPTATYGMVHNRVREKIRELRAEIAASGSNPDRVPLVFMAHSLGGQVMSNYILDTQDAPPPGAGRFMRLGTLAGIITFGCSIPLFSFAHCDTTPRRMPRFNSNDFKRWINVYNPNDFLAYPLQGVPGYDGMVRDIPMHVGGLMGWTPVCHLFYWTDRKFIKLVADFLPLCFKTTPTGKKARHRRNRAAVTVE